jgi:hypothetical protein
MTFPAGVRKLGLTLHVVAALGWLGAVLVFLALALIGLTAADPATARGAYLVMEPAARLVLVPLAVLSLLTGIVQSLGTHWGLFRHYWVIFKLLITLAATGILLIYMQTFARMSAVAADAAADVAVVRNASPALHASLALVALLLTAILGIYKPRGMTRYGWRKRNDEAVTTGGGES